MISRIDCNKPNPQFGAFKIEPPYQSSKKFVKYTGMANSRLIQRGYKQVVRMLKDFKHYDVVFNAENNNVSVVKKGFNRVVEVFSESPSGITGLNHFGVFTFPGRKILAGIFQPRKFLPYNINLGVERATVLEKEAEKLRKTNKIVDRINRM